MAGSSVIAKTSRIVGQLVVACSCRRADVRVQRGYGVGLVVVVVMLLMSRSGQTTYAQTPSPEVRATVGFQKTIRQIVVPGSELQPKPINDRDQSIIVRILKTYSHGTDFRYDLEFRGLDPGQFNLADYLQRIDATDQQPIPAMPIVVHSLLPPGQVQPTPLVAEPARYRSFYLPLLIVGSTLWTIGFLMILFYGRGKTSRPVREMKPVTVADRLQALIDAAVSGEITTEQQAELERVLSSFWSQKMRWEHLSAVQIREKLRGHPEASQLLDQIDRWLHRPETGTATSPVDVAKLLEPYR